MKKRIISIVFVLIIIAIIGFYVFDLVVNDVKPEKNLFRTVSVVCISVGAIIRINVGRGRRSLDFYEKQYQKTLLDAFTHSDQLRKKLLIAIRYYNENKINKSLKLLFKLNSQCQKENDTYVVYLFTALCLTDLAAYEQAQKIYQKLVFMEIADSTIFSNLGHVQMKTGQYKDALINYNHALEFDEKNAYAYNNIAQAHFEMHEFEKATEFALKALEINPKMHQASSLLAIIYALKDDKTNSEKYFHIAINSGEKPQRIKNAIAYFRTAQNTTDET